MNRAIVPFVLFALAAGAPATLAATDVLQFDAPFVLNGVELQPGAYRIAVSPSLDSVQFVRRGKSVASSPCTVTLIDPSIPRDEVHFRPDAAGRGKVTALVLSRAGMSVKIPDTVAVTSGSVASAAGAR